MRSLVAITAALAAVVVSVPAWANQAGLAGYSGKPNLSAPAGESCRQCHSGGAAPTVTINGPTTLAAGQAAEYSVVVQTGQARAAAAIAATDGIVLAPLSGLRDSFGEMVPDAPVNVAGGQATFRFRVTAPLTGNTLRLWAVGLAANGNSGVGGDNATHTTRDVAVTGGGPPKPDAGASSSGDGGSSGGTSGSSGGTSGSGGGTSGSSGGTSGSGGGTSGSSGGTSGSGGGTSGSSGDTGDDDPSAAPGKADDAPSCSSSTSARTNEAALAGAGVIAMLALTRRRRRRA